MPDSVYPASLDTFVDPLGTDNLATVDHALQHRKANDALAALETKVGTGSTPLNGTFVAQVPAATNVAATDVANIQNALNAGGRVMLGASSSATPYNLGSGANPITVKANSELIGHGPGGSVCSYAGAGWAVILGNNGALGAPLAYGCRFEGVDVVLTNIAGNGVKCVETAGAVRRNIRVERSVAGSSTGIGFMRDGGNTADILGVDENCYGLHVKFPHRWGTSGSSTTTSVTATACTALGDVANAGVGLTVDASCGNGSRWIGGDIESNATGVSHSGVGVIMVAPRFEANTLDVILNAGAKAMKIVDASAIVTFTDNSGNLTNSIKSQDNAGNPLLYNTGSTVMLAAPVIALHAVNIGTAAYVDLDLSATMPLGKPTAVIVRLETSSPANAAAYSLIRKKGVTTGGMNGDGSVVALYVNTAGKTNDAMAIIPCDGTGKIQYTVQGYGGAAGDYLLVDVVGWVA